MATAGGTLTRRRRRVEPTDPLAALRQTTFVAAMSSTILDLHGSRLDRERGYDRLVFADEVASVGRGFKRKYRMEFDVFTALVEQLRPRLRRNDAQARRRYCRGLPGRRAVSEETQVAAALRFYAGASYLDVVSTHKVEPSSFYAIVKRVTSAVNKELRLAGDITTEAGQVALSSTFVGALPLNPLAPSVVGALDGLAVRIQGPARGATNTPSEFYGRKGFFSSNVQAICDGRCRFVFVSTAAPGAMHDSAAWSQTRLAERLQAAVICLGERFVICDDSFSACSHLAPPWPGAALPADRAAFNFFLSQVRQTIERAFGILNKKWGILWSALRVRLGDCGSMVLALMKLHNFIIDRTPATSPPDLGPDDSSPLVFSDEQSMEDADEDCGRDGPACLPRLYWTSRLSAAGYARPAVV